MRAGESCAQRHEGGEGTYQKATMEPCHFHVSNGAANIAQVLVYKNMVFMEELTMWLVISLPDN